MSADEREHYFGENFSPESGGYEVIEVFKPPVRWRIVCDAFNMIKSFYSRFQVQKLFMLNPRSLLSSMQWENLLSLTLLPTTNF